MVDRYDKSEDMIMFVFLFRAIIAILIVAFLCGIHSELCKIRQMLEKRVTKEPKKD